LFLFFVTEWLEAEDNEEPFTILYTIALIYYISHLIFSISINVIKKRGIILPTQSKNTDSSTSKGLISTLVNTFFTFLGSTTMICAGGACSSIYISVLTSFFGAFGVAIADLIPYFNGLVFLLILFTLYSLYIKKKSLKYKPFLVGCIGSISILT